MSSPVFTDSQARRNRRRALCSHEVEQVVPRADQVGQLPEEDAAMTTFSDKRHQTRPRVRIAAILIAVAAVVALAVALIALPRAGRARSATTGSAAGAYAPLVRFHGTGAPPVAGGRRSPLVLTHASAGGFPPNHGRGAP
jgi:hypothetical protein